jgi:hypothetical protein
MGTARRNRRAHPLRTDNNEGRGVTEREQLGIELLLSEPEIVSWLELRDDEGDDDEQPRVD